MTLILAEFIIHLSEKNNTLASFKAALIENGAEFSDSFVSNLLRIIQHMRPKKSNDTEADTSPARTDALAQKFPGLAIPNEPQIPLMDDEEDKKDAENDKDIVADLMAQFEKDAPSTNQSKEPEHKHKERSRSRDKDSSRRRRDRSRSRHRDRRDRSRNRHRSRDRHRDRSRSRHRSRSNDRHRNRTRDRRSRERHRSRERNNRDGSVDRHGKKELELDEEPVPGKVSENYAVFIYYFMQICLLSSKKI